MTRIHKEARNEEEIGAPSKNNISAYNTREPAGFFRAQGRCLSQRYTHTHTHSFWVTSAMFSRVGV